MPGPLDHLNIELCEHAPDAVMIVDPDGIIVYVNHLSETMFRSPRDVLIGSSVEALIAPELREQHVSHRTNFHAAAHPRPMGTGLRLEGMRADGDTFPVEISLSPLEGSDGTMLVMAAVRDVSDRERAEEALRFTEAELATANERDRIARDLHDTVIQQLFAIGMSLQSVRGSIADPAQAERLDWAVDELDRTIREVRSVIFGLQSPRGDSGLRSQIMFLAREAQRTLGFEPTVRFTGLVDTMVNDAVAEQVVLAAREALANVVRHSRATNASVRVSVGDGSIVLVVTDNGIGIPKGATPGHGLRNLTERAEAYGGACVVTTAPGSGTSVEWQVPTG